MSQAVDGQCVKPRPGMWRTAEEKAKYEAWSKLGNMTRAEAMHLYVQECTLRYTLTQSE